MKFKIGQKVLVRNCSSSPWLLAQYAFEQDNVFYAVGGNKYFFCIKYDKSLLGKVGSE